MIQKLLSGFNNNVLSTTLARYVGPTGGGQMPDTEASCIFPQAGIIRNVYVWLSEAPGGGGTYTVVLRESNPTPGDAAWSIAITDPATSGNSGANEYAVSAGDHIGFKVTPSGSPTATPKIAIICEFEPTSGGDFTVGSRNRGTTSTAGVKKYLAINGNAYGTTSENQHKQIMPACTLTAFSFCRSVAVGVDNSEMFTVMKNGVATAATVTFTNADAASLTRTWTGSIAFAEGDLISIECDDAGTSPASTFAARWGICCTPDTSGEYPLMASGPAPSSAGSNRFHGLSGYYGQNGGLTATESNTYTYGRSDCTLKKLLAYCFTAQGAGNTCVVNLRKDGVDETGSIAAITFSNETGIKTSSGTLSLVNNSYYDTLVLLSAGGATSLVAVTYLANEAGGDVEVSGTTDGLILTENEAGINAETNVQAGIDALAITENVAQVNLNVSVAAIAGALSISTYDAIIKADISIAAGVDALIITENNATVEVGGDVDVQAVTDALILTANAASIKADTSITASIDALVITENAASVKLNVSIAASVDALAITENVASIKADISIGAGVDNLIITENVATVEAGGDVNVLATTQALLLAAFSAVVNVNNNILANYSAMILAEHGANVKYSQSLSFAACPSPTNALSFSACPAPTEVLSFAACIGTTNKITFEEC